MNFLALIFFCSERRPIVALAGGERPEPSSFLFVASKVCFFVYTPITKGYTPSTFIRNSKCHAPTKIFAKSASKNYIVASRGPGTSIALFC